MRRITNSLLIKTFAVTLVLFTLVLVYGYPTGITGRTKKTSTAGCGSCHTNNTSIIGAVTGPDTVNTGSVTTYTITITRSGSTAQAGCDIAVRLGSLTPGTGLKLQSGELTHISGWSLSGGTVSRTFTYTAPSAPGIDTIWSTVAVGHTNGFNWSPEKRVVVKGPLKVEEPAVTAQYKLNQNYPNPFNPETVISFELPKSSDVKLTIFDITGSVVKDLFEGNLSQGSHELEWNASGLPSGLYFYRLSTVSGANGISLTRKMILAK